MKFILDLIIVVIIVISVLLGVRKGFIKTVLALAGMVLVFMLAWRLSVPLGNKIDAKIINPVFRGAAAQSISDKIGVELSKGDEELQLEQFEDDIESYNDTHEEGLFSLVGISKSEVKAAADSAVGGVVSALFRLVDKVSSSASRVIAFIVLLIAGALLLFIIKLIITPILKVFRLKKLDSLLGGILGLARGIIIVLLFAFAVRLGQPMIDDKLTKDDIDNTLIFKYSYRIMGTEE